MLHHRLHYILPAILVTCLWHTACLLRGWEGDFGGSEGNVGVASDDGTTVEPDNSDSDDA